MRALSLKILILFCCVLQTVYSQKPKYYAATWESLKNYNVPDWYYDAKFGIWTHWGVYSVPAYRGTHAAEWYPKWMYLVEDPNKPFGNYEKQGAATARHHVEKYGGPAKFGYHDFIPMFKAEKWNPDDWAQFCVDCGSKFFVITAMHHDGFAMYNSDYTPWNAYKMGPKRDLVGDLEKAVHKKGLKFGVSNHFAHNASHYKYFFDNGFDTIFNSRPELRGLYSSGVEDDAYLLRWWNITREIVDKYTPDLYWFDWCWNPSFWDKERPEFCAYYYNDAIRHGKGVYGNPGVVINYKNSAIQKGCAVFDMERGSMSDKVNYIWQTDTSVSDYSWGYSDDDTFKTPKQLITMLVDITSKNGILLLNFGPKADGTIPDECKRPMLEMGKWLKKNGEAIYASRPWQLAAEGPITAGTKNESELYTSKDIRYTQSKDGKKVYVTMFGLPMKQQILNSVKVISSSPASKVTMLSNNKNIPFKITKDKKLQLDFSKINSKNAGCDYAYSFRIENMYLQAVHLNSIEQSELYMKMPKSEKPKSAVKLPVFLSSLKSLYEKAHNGVKRDVNYHGKKILIGGKSFDKGLMICPVGDYGQGVFVVDAQDFGNAKYFTAEVGIDDAATTAGSCTFVVEACVKGVWKRLFESKKLTYKDNSLPIKIEIPRNTKYMRFITTDAGDGCSADHAEWADAKFTD